MPRSGVDDDIESAGHLELSGRDSLLVLELLQNPPVANAKLREAATQLTLQAADVEADGDGAATLKSVSAEIDNIIDAAESYRSAGEPTTRTERLKMEIETFDDVFDALADTRAEAANMKPRADLLSLLVVRIKSWGLPQGTAAARLGITRPRLNDPMRGKLGKFSRGALVNFATPAGLVLEIRVASAA